MGFQSKGDPKKSGTEMSDEFDEEVPILVVSPGCGFARLFRANNVSLKLVGIGNLTKHLEREVVCPFFPNRSGLKTSPKQVTSLLDLELHQLPGPGPMPFPTRPGSSWLKEGEFAKKQWPLGVL